MLNEHDCRMRGSSVLLLEERVIKRNIAVAVCICDQLEHVIIVMRLMEVMCLASRSRCVTFVCRFYWTPLVFRKTLMRENKEREREQESTITLGFEIWYKDEKGRSYIPLVNLNCKRNIYISIFRPLSRAFSHTKSSPPI